MARAGRPPITCRRWLARASCVQHAEMSHNLRLDGAATRREKNSRALQNRAAVACRRQEEGSMLRRPDLEPERRQLGAAGVRRRGRGRWRAGDGGPAGQRDSGIAQDQSRRKSCSDTSKVRWSMGDKTNLSLSLRVGRDAGVRMRWMERCRLLTKLASTSPTLSNDPPGGGALAAA